MESSGNSSTRETHHQTTVQKRPPTGASVCFCSRDERPPSGVPKLIDAAISDTYILCRKLVRFLGMSREAVWARRIAPSNQRFLAPMSG